MLVPLFFLGTSLNPLTIMPRMPNKIVSVDPEGGAWWAYLAPRLNVLDSHVVGRSPGRQGPRSFPHPGSV